jgi:hypothetical protein
VFGRGAYPAGIQALNLHGFTTAFRNIGVFGILLGFGATIQTFKSNFFGHEFLPKIYQ